ncbi:hypothetical protein AB0E04_03765 [Streptomyces sp. NPDC048251]|uniref:hypothetical protein n=1 Tax=Streptomyces sp. NPDC048251 TaxID=3154501 RepID=UPI00344528DC
MAGYDPNITPLEMTIRNARDHQREMEKHGNEQGVRNAQKKIDETLDELHIRQELKGYRAQD